MQELGPSGCLEARGGACLACEDGPACGEDHGRSQLPILVPRSDCSRILGAHVVPVCRGQVVLWMNGDALNQAGHVHFFSLYKPDIFEVTKSGI